MQRDDPEVVIAPISLLHANNINSDKPAGFSVSELVSWSLTSLFSTNMAISETNGHSLYRTPSSPLFSRPGLSPWS